MTSAPSFTFYTYSPDFEREEPQWQEDGFGNRFFGSVETARKAILDLRAAILRDPADKWTPVRLERIETLPVTGDILLALLNNGVAALVQNYEIVETIGEDC